VNAHDDVDSTRGRILTAAMQLFGEQGYAGTRVGQIEAAAGLSRGAGGLYRHFPSKKAVLEAGISQAIETGTDLVGLIDDPSALSALPLEGRLLLVAQAALRRLEHDRDLNRLVCRDLAQFPDLLTKVRDEEIVRTFEAFAAWLRHQPETESRNDVDWDGVAAVLIGATFHYWFLRDTFRTHPTGIKEDRYVRTAVALTTALAHDVDGDET
jgi:AcrR family transcriptional regulator